MLSDFIYRNLIIRARRFIGIHLLLLLIFLVTVWAQTSSFAAEFEVIQDLTVGRDTKVSGNVGVGEAVSGTGDKLYVAGNAGISGDLTIGGAVSYSADLTLSGGAVSLIDGTAQSPSLNFVNDADTGLFRPAAETIAFTTAGTEDMRIADGNLGIGTTSPTQKLHVEGQCVTADTLLPIISAEKILNPKSEIRNKSQFSKSQIPNSLENCDLEFRNCLGFSASDLEFKQIKDVKSGDYVLSLNEETGSIEPHRIKGLLDMGVKPVFRLTTTSGRTIRTTGNHPYLVKGVLSEEQRQTIAQERIKAIVQKEALVIEDFSEEREFSEPRFVWQDLERNNSVSHLAMVDVSDKDGFRFPENKFNAVIADTQPKFFELSTFQFNYFSMLKGMIKLADLFNFSHNARLFSNRQPSQFLFRGGMKEIIEHKNGYLDDFTRLLSRLSTSLAGSQDPARSAVFTRASVSLIDSGEDNSMKSTTSSNNSLERTLDGAITPRRFLSSIIVKGKDLLIENYHNIALDNLSRGKWTKVVYLAEGDEIAVVDAVAAGLVPA